MHALHTHIIPNIFVYGRVLSRDDFFSGFGSTSYDPPSYSKSSGGGASHTSSSSSTIPSDSHFFGKHSAFSNSGGSSVDRPSGKVSSFGGMSGSSNSRGGGERAQSTWSTPGSSDNAQKRFSGAKSISSDQYFGRESTSDQVSVILKIKLLVCMCLCCFFLFLFSITIMATLSVQSCFFFFFGWY